MKKAWRRSGLLKRLKKQSYPKRILCFDTETYPITDKDGKDEQHLKLGVAIYTEFKNNLDIKKRNVYRFTTTDEFYKILESHLSDKEQLYCFAHNMGFDLMVLNPFDRWHKQGIDLHPPITGGFRFIWRVKHPLGSIQFINTGNYVNFSLERIGQDLGFNKLEIDFHEATDEELFIYCERDTDIVEYFVIRLLHFLRDNHLGGFRPTLASQALSVYRYKFMPETIYLHTDELLHMIERSCYHGGRTEAFYIGDVPESPIYQLDINSMYPYCMQQGNIPVEFRGAMCENRSDVLEHIVENNYVIVDCIIQTKEPVYGVKWIKDKYKIIETELKPNGSKLIFPIGTFRKTLHHDEFVYALQHGHILKVINIYAYRGADIFSEYVHFFNDMKVKASIEDNKTDRLMAKLFNNSLYGKFGQLFKTNEVVVKGKNLPISPMDEYTIKTGEHSILFNWFNDVWRESTNGESAYSFSAIAGCITARSRMLLWDYMLIVGRDNVYYCDTDSIYTNAYGFQLLKTQLHDTQLGAMAHEETLEHMTINGAKDYTKDGKRKTKGVPAKAHWLSNDVSIGTRFEGFKEWRNSGMNRPPTVHEQIKVRANTYDKGLIGDDNWIEPYILEALT